MDSKDLAKIDTWLEQLSMEISFSKEGDDRGQFPVRDLFANISEKAGADPAFSAMRDLGNQAAVYIEDMMIGGQKYNSESLAKLKGFLEELRHLRQFSGGGAAAVPATAPAPVPVPVPMAAAPTPVPAPEIPLEIVEVSAEEIPLTMNMESDAELLKEFINESKEHLQNVEQGILVLEENPTDENTLNSTFRAFHSFKGGSGFLNLIPINKLAHELESLLDLARTRQMQIDSSVINLILEGGDTLREFITIMEPMVLGAEPARTFTIRTSDLVRRVKEVIHAVKSGGTVPAAAPAPVVASVAAAPAPAPMTVEAPKPVAPKIEAKPAPAPTSAPVPAVAQKPAPAAAAATPSTGGAVVKIDTYKLDNLVDLVGELVIAQSQVSQDTDLKSITSLKLTRNVSQMARITKELQKTAMSLRMVPIRATFQKMQRLVRDLGAKQGKELALELFGEETEVDRTIAEEISDPLVHMVRNSCDHGIERPEDREAKGKPRLGTVRLKAYHQGGSIVIEVKDDGAGLNKDRIVAKAIERGLITPDAKMEDREIFMLIFEPGFSTAAVVTDISGRGVGMDVVKKNIEKLRGKVEIESVLGEGTTFFIFLPLTLAIIDGMLITVGGQKFIIPTLSVRESFRPTEAMLSSVHERGEMVNVRGHLMTMIRLADFFEVEARAKTPMEGIVVVVEDGHDVKAILVDDLIGKQEIVIKSLNEQFKSNRALSGAAILGDGTVGLILDVTAFSKSKHELSRAA